MTTLLFELAGPAADALPTSFELLTVSRTDEFDDREQLLRLSGDYDSSLLWSSVGLGAAAVG